MPAAPDPKDYHFVALEGFSEFERTALASFFRLAAHGAHGYVRLEDSARSDFLIADGDHQSALDAVQASGRMADTVFIGRSAPAGAGAWLPRPIEPVRIVRELDALVELRRAAPTVRIEPMPVMSVDLLLHDLEPSQDGAAPRGMTTVMPGRGGAGRDVLVADDSAVARKFLMRRLQRLGYRVHLAQSGEQAIEMLGQRSFAIAFLDITLGPAGSVDGLHVCQHIKQHGAGAASRTAVVMVTGLASSSDRVRGSLAGCDAYLSKPLAESEFIAALREVDRQFIWDADAPE